MKSYLIYCLNIVNYECNKVKNSYEGVKLAVHDVKPLKWIIGLHIINFPRNRLLIAFFSSQHKNSQHDFVNRKHTRLKYDSSNSHRSFPLHFFHIGWQNIASIKKHRDDIQLQGNALSIRILSNSANQQLQVVTFIYGSILALSQQ